MRGLRRSCDQEMRKVPHGRILYRRLFQEALEGAQTGLHAVMRGAGARARAHTARHRILARWLSTVACLHASPVSHCHTVLRTQVELEQQVAALSDIREQMVLRLTGIADKATKCMQREQWSEAIFWYLQSNVPSNVPSGHSRACLRVCPHTCPRTSRDLFLACMFLR